MAGGGLHEDLSRDALKGPPAERSFGLTFAVVCALAAALMFWRHPDRVALPLVLSVASAAFLLAALLLPSLLRPLNHVWYLVGLVLHKIVNPLVMGAMFFLVFTPFGVARRLAGRHSGLRHLDRNAASYWIPRTPPGPDPASMTRQY